MEQVLVAEGAQSAIAGEAHFLFAGTEQGDTDSGGWLSVVQQNGSAWSGPFYEREFQIGARLWQEGEPAGQISISFHFQGWLAELSVEID
jgi:hypothetical protein